MKITRRELRKIIAEAVSFGRVELPQGEGGYQTVKIMRDSSNIAQQTLVQKVGINPNSPNNIEKFMIGGQDESGIVIVNILGGGNNRILIYFNGNLAAEFSESDDAQYREEEQNGPYTLAYLWMRASRTQWLKPRDVDLIKDLASHIGAQSNDLANHINKNLKNPDNLVALVASIGSEDLKIPSIAQAYGLTSSPTRSGTYDPDYNY